MGTRTTVRAAGWRQTGHQNYQVVRRVNGVEVVSREVYPTKEAAKAAAKAS